MNEKCSLVYDDEDTRIFLKESHSPYDNEHPWSVSYHVQFLVPHFRFKYIEENILLVRCNDIPIQEWKDIGCCHLTDKGKERWNTWGPDYYGMSVDEYLQMHEYAKWFPQLGVNAVDVSQTKYGTYNISTIVNEFKLYNETYNPFRYSFYKDNFYDYNKSSDVFINTCASSSVKCKINFEKKHNILELIENMIESDENLLTK